MADIDKLNELVGNKDFANAALLAEEQLKDEPNNVELLKLAGLVDVNLEKWFTARNYFESVVKYQPDDATSWFYLANCYEKLSDNNSAQNAYIKVIDLRNESIEAYQSLCVLLLKMNKPSEALTFAERANIVAPDNYLFDFIIGTSYMKLRDFNKSIEPLESALRKSPNNAGIYNSLGTAYMTISNADKAIECYKKSMELDSENPMTYYNLGSAYQIKQNHEEAIVYLRKASEINDEDESFKVALGMSLIKAEKYQDAAEVYKKLLVHHPEKENYKYNLVTCYEALGDIKTAIKLLEGMVYLNQKFLPPAKKLAQLYVQVNEPRKAKEIYDNILLKNNPSAETLHQYAILSSSLCDTDTAEKILKKSLKMNPNLARAHKDLGIIYLNKRLFDYAEDEFKTAMKLLPNDFEILFEYGNFLYSVSKNNEAERYYTEALYIEPDNVLALTFMALNKLILNQLDEAKEYIMKAIKLNPHHEYIQFCAGRIMYARGEFEDAKRYLIKAVEQNPDIETQNTLALTYFALEDYNQALNIFNNLLSKHQDNISILMNIAKCYEKLHDNDKALEILDKVVDIFPENEDAQEMIRKLS